MTIILQYKKLKVDSSWYFFGIFFFSETFTFLKFVPISDDFSRWLFRNTVPDEYFGCLFVIPRLILILATNSYFHGRFLFQPIIGLIGPTTDSLLNDGFLLQNYGPDPPWYFCIIIYSFACQFSHHY